MGPPDYPDSRIPTLKKFCRDYRVSFFGPIGDKTGRNYIIIANSVPVGTVGYDLFDDRKRRVVLDIWMRAEKYCAKGYGTDALGFSAAAAPGSKKPENHRRIPFLCQRTFLWQTVSSITTQFEWYESLFENYAHRYDKECFVQGTAGECDFIEDEINHDKSLKIMDIGCGTGRHAIELTKRGHNVTGVDLSESQLAREKEKAEEAGATIDFQKYDARNLPCGGVDGGRRNGVVIWFSKNQPQDVEFN